MWTLVTDQGTATPETGLCDVCFNILENQQIARAAAREFNDINPDKGFVKCSENEAISCCVCGKMEIKDAKIDRWRIVLTDENGIDIDLDADLPDYISQTIDDMIEAEYDVEWEI